MYVLHQNLADIIQAAREEPDEDPDIYLAETRVHESQGGVPLQVESFITITWASKDNGRLHGCRVRVERMNLLVGNDRQVLVGVERRLDEAGAIVRQEFVDLGCTVRGGILAAPGLLEDLATIIACQDLWHIEQTETGRELIPAD